MNFADRRSADGIPTVRIARTLIVNFHRGRDASKDGFHAPIVCSSGPGIDEEYREILKTVDWQNEALKTAGQQFAKLHRLQRDRVLNRSKDKYLEFANKAIHPCMVASWAYAAGFFQHDKGALEAHYSLADSCLAPDDPLNAKALLTAHLQGVDPEAYRGLGARINNAELGRMLEVFLLQATRATKRGVNSKLANTAIKSYEAKKAQNEANRALKRL